MTAMERSAVAHHRWNGVSEIVFDLPTSMNTFRAEYIDLLAAAVETVQREGSRCVILRGAGDVFSAGWDLTSIKAGDDDPFGIITDLVGPLCQRLRELPIPTVSAVAGPALGFGLGLALSCDICIANEDAILGSSFRRVGLVPDTGSHFYLQERLGINKALELIYTGKMLSGAEAAALGLINHAVAAGTVAEEARKLARDIASGPTQAFRLSKQLLLAKGDYSAMMRAEAKAQVEAFATADAIEGIRAFQNGELPRFVGK